MTPPAAPPRHARPVDPAPRSALAAGVLAGLGALVLVYVAFLVLALGGLSSDGADRSWALLPLAAGLTAALGCVRLLLRRRGRGVLAVSCLLAAAFVALLAAQAADLGEDPPLGPAALLLAGPVLALALSLTPPVRRWLAATA